MNGEPKQFGNNPRNREGKKLEEQLGRWSEHLEGLVKERLRELKELEEKYRTLVKTSPDAIAITELEEGVTHVSEQTLALHDFFDALPQDLVY